MPVQRFSTPIAVVDQRLRKLQDVLEQSKAPDGSVDLRKAKALAGTDQQVSLLVHRIRWSDESSALTPEQARRQFMELQSAIQSTSAMDHDQDGKLGYEELPHSYSDDKSAMLVRHAASPKEITYERPTPRAFLSLEARRYAEEKISALAEHHAATPEGREALKWAMRLDLARGFDVDNRQILDPIIYSEKSWQRHLPFIGRQYREGRGHLSDQELEARYGPDLAAYVERTKARVNQHLLMDYETEFLAGKDLP